MTIENTSSDGNTCTYYSVEASSTELVLQPRCSRRKAMLAAWSSFGLFEILFLPLMTILPALLVTIAILAFLSATEPGWQNHWLTHSVIFSLWTACFTAIVFLTGKAIWTSGYTTFIFDRLEQQLAIHTVNLLGRKFVQRISFAKIQDARWQKHQDEGFSVQVSLLLEPQKIWGFTHQQTIILSSFASIGSNKTVATLTAQKHHQELLLLVRTTLGFSTYEIVKELQRSLPIPTEEELEQQKAQAVLEATDALKEVAKMMFSSGQTKQAELEEWRQKTRNFPEDPKAWEQFALILAVQKKASKDEVVSAYRQAEALYRDRGDLDRAANIAQTLKRIG
jgi:hypothetical protein